MQRIKALKNHKEINLTMMMIMVKRDKARLIKRKVKQQ